jgi:hypothetical protein
MIINKENHPHPLKDEEEKNAHIFACMCNYSFGREK